MVNNTGSADDRFFENGPPLRMQEWLGLVKQGRSDAVRRALIVILAGWVPIAALALPYNFGSFLADAGVHARSLVAAPLFILAEATCAPRLGALAMAFFTGGLIAERDQERYVSAIASTRRLLKSRAAEAMVVALAYAAVLAFALTTPSENLPAWHTSGSGLPGALSPAGWWHVVVSLPLLLMLFFGWMWRLVLWTRFLWLMSRLDLRLIAAHPDQAAGLGFLAQSVRLYSAVAFPLAAIVAGRVANGFTHDGVPFQNHRSLIIGVVVLSVALFAGPLLVFSLKLVHEWRRGVFEYGTLAASLGREFESKWFAHDRKLNAEILNTQDFSAATDLYQVVAHVYAMRLAPIDLRSLVMLAGATLLPFLPVALIQMPVDVLLTKVKELFL